MRGILNMILQIVCSQVKRIINGEGGQLSMGEPLC